MRHILYFLLLSLLPLLQIYAQAPTTYEDVGLIINERDTNSVAIGEYFAQRREIPERNIIRVNVSAAETINDSTFQILRAQIEAYLVSTGLVDSLNYLVTTKGVPLRVNRGGLGGDVNSASASVDAELMLILGRWADHIGKATLVIPPNQVRVHPYFGKDESFGRKKLVPGTSAPYDMYLVTRLIGLTKEDVFRLIDNSGPFTFVNKDSALFVLDQDPTPIDPVYNNHLVRAETTLLDKEWRVLFNGDSIFVTDQENVLGYASWGSNDDNASRYATRAMPRNKWSPASIAETYVSTSARNFIPGQTSGQSRIADLIAEGCTGASGYVFEPFSFALTWVHILFDRYTRGFNLAESFYMSNPTMSWMAIVVGDPKTSIVTERPITPTPWIDVQARACAGDVVTFQARNALAGNMAWFAGDSVSVNAQGPPFDERHPLWVGRDSLLSRFLNDAGTFTMTFLNENFVGAGFAQTTVEVFPALKAGFILSADTLYLDEQPTLTVTDTTASATSWTWNFGEGDQAGERVASYSFSRSGTFNVRLIVSNEGCSKTVTKPLVVLSTRVTSVETAAPAAFLLEQNHPNPFNPSTTIRFTLAKRERVQLLVSSLDGSLIATIMDVILDEGTHAVPFSADELPSGTYRYELQTLSNRTSRFMTLIK